MSRNIASCQEKNEMSQGRGDEIEWMRIRWRMCEVCELTFFKQKMFLLRVSRSAFYRSVFYFRLFWCSCAAVLILLHTFQRVTWPDLYAWDVIGSLPRAWGCGVSVRGLSSSRRASRHVSVACAGISYISCWEFLHILDWMDVIYAMDWGRSLRGQVMSYQSFNHSPRRQG